jgi:hypothetical protein
MKRSQLTPRLELRYCSYSCEHAELSGNVPGCMTANPIYCGKHHREVEKSALCLDNRGRKK